MDTLRWVLLESPAALALPVAFALFVLLVYWRRTERVQPLRVGIAVGGLLFVVQALVTTRREHAVALLNRIEQCVLNSDADGMRPLLASDFRAGSRDADAFVEFVRRQFERLEVLTVRRQRMQVQAEGTDSAAFAAEVSYIGTVSTRSFRGFLESRWRIVFVRAPQGWRIGSIQPRMIGGVDVPTWSMLERF